MDIDDKTMTQIVASSEFHFVKKGHWVFRQDSIGTRFYLLLHG
jgi:CRP-like cAMP-binding protein